MISDKKNNLVQDNTKSKRDRKARARVFEHKIASFKKATLFYK